MYVCTAIIRRSQGLSNGGDQATEATEGFTSAHSSLKYLLSNHQKTYFAQGVETEVFVRHCERAVTERVPAVSAGLTPFLYTRQWLYFPSSMSIQIRRTTQTFSPMLKRTRTMVHFSSDLTFMFVAQLTVLLANFVRTICPRF